MTAKIIFNMPLFCGHMNTEKATFGYSSYSIRGIEIILAA
jgi:hypothetical protein